MKLIAAAVLRQDFRNRWTACALALGALLSPPSIAATFRVDDSASIPNETNVTMRWKSANPNKLTGNTVEGGVLITLRLNVAPWLNKTGRIYMALPQQPIGMVTVAWTTQGRLLPGTLNSGERTIVYAGPIRSATLEDTFVVKVETDGKRLANPQRMQFHFEIDVD
jgi:hypothetical protein